MQTYIQTGDVLYFPNDLDYSDFKELKSNLIHQGQNHRHEIVGDFKLYGKENELVIVCNKTCKLTHGEHNPLELKKGVYRKRIVQEYDHFLEESRQVID